MVQQSLLISTWLAVCLWVLQVASVPLVDTTYAQALESRQETNEAASVEINDADGFGDEVALPDPPPEPYNSVLIPVGGSDGNTDTAKRSFDRTNGFLVCSMAGGELDSTDGIRMTPAPLNGFDMPALLLGAKQNASDQYFAKTPLEGPNHDQFRHCPTGAGGWGFVAIAHGEALTGDTVFDAQDVFNLVNELYNRTQRFPNQGFAYAGKLLDANKTPYVDFEVIECLEYLDFNPQHPPEKITNTDFKLISQVDFDAFEANPTQDDVPAAAAGGGGGGGRRLVKRDEPFERITIHRTNFKMFLYRTSVTVTYSILDTLIRQAMSELAIGTSANPTYPQFMVALQGMSPAETTMMASKPLQYVSEGQAQTTRKLLTRIMATLGAYADSKHWSGSIPGGIGSKNTKAIFGEIWEFPQRGAKKLVAKFTIGELLDHYLACQTQAGDQARMSCVWRFFQ